MIVGIGIDLVLVSRVRKLAERFPERIGHKVFTAAELVYCLAKADPAISLAGRFAAKEALMKALGTGWGSGVRFIDIEIIRAPSGQPSVALSGRASEIAHARGITDWHVSITHDGDFAMAMVIAESRTPQV